MRIRYKYLSFGAGVNSTALLLLLKDKGYEFETVFVDTGVEWPETYEYIEYLRSKGFEIKVIKSTVEGRFNSLYDYCLHYKILPRIRWRWCTHKFKLRPLWRYFKKPCIVYVGISYDERHRALPNGKYFSKKEPNLVRDIKVEYPLIEWKITRYDCIRIIKEHGLKVPPKSGCWLCPFQTKKQLLRLQTLHPELFKKLIELEKATGKTLLLEPLEKRIPIGIKPLTEWLK